MTRFITKFYAQFTRGGVTLITGFAKMTIKLQGTVVVAPTQNYQLGVGIVESVAA